MGTSRKLETNSSADVLALPKGCDDFFWAWKFNYWMLFRSKLLFLNYANYSMLCSQLQDPLYTQGLSQVVLKAWKGVLTFIKDE